MFCRLLSEPRAGTVLHAQPFEESILDIWNQMSRFVTMTKFEMLAATEMCGEGEYLPHAGLEHLLG